MSNLFSIERRPSFLDIIEISIKLFISLCKLYLLGKYANFVSFKIFLNFSNPNPIITVENVPPKTMIRGGIKKRALNVPPSKKKAPNIESIPKAKPLSVLSFLIISNSIMNLS